MVRHSRSAAFDAARRSISPSARHWSELATDPNDPEGLAHRAATLTAAWRPDITDRVSFLEQRCRGRHVLDIGCVAHDVERLEGEEWLHGRIARSAATCIGVDILEEGVAAVNAAGFEAIAHDLSTGLGPLADRAPFDVIVAGELLEHVPDLGMVFRVAAEGLANDGALILTTPNPYAPQRVRAGQLGIVWENVDHIMYAFPSGIAELADRTGLVLTEAATISDDGTGATRYVARLKRTIRGSGWRNVGYASVDAGDQTPVDAGLVGRLLRRGLRPRRRFLGETFVYVITRPAATPSSGHAPGAA